MANNRIYLYCPFCNRHMYLGKCYAEGYLNSTRSYDQVGATMLDFLDEHFWCASTEARQIQLRWESHKDFALPQDSKPDPGSPC